MIFGVKIKTYFYRKKKKQISRKNHEIEIFFARKFKYFVFFEFYLRWFLAWKIKLNIYWAEYFILNRKISRKKNILAGKFKLNFLTITLKKGKKVKTEKKKRPELWTSSFGNRWRISESHHDVGNCHKDKRNENEGKHF